MNHIKKLSSDLINQIAAGEVIERPACIVRELLDNSLDAQAKDIHIFVEIINDNINISISDNGTGISKEDLNTAFQRHTTSKINRFEDIFLLNTLGFRGEGLAAVSAISKIEVLTSTSNEGKGFQAFL